MITLVTVDRIDAVWPHIRAALEHACLRTGGDISSADLWQLCRSGEGFLIVAHDGGEKMQAASVWKRETKTTGCKLRCMALAGKGMKIWFDDLIEVARELAIDCGAASVVFEGRKGWGRIRPKARQMRVVYEELL